MFPSARCAWPRRCRCAFTWSASAGACTCLFPLTAPPPAQVVEVVQRYDDTCASGATPALREAALQQVRAATPADRTRVARRSAGPLRRSGRRGARGGAAGSGGGHRLPAHADRAGQDARPRLFVLRARQLLSEPPSARPPLPLSSDQRAAHRDCAGLRASGRARRLPRLPRRYVRSRSDAQLRGGDPAPGALASCDPQLFQGGNASLVIEPCGLVAWSLFNDSFQARPRLLPSACPWAVCSMDHCYGTCVVR